jgi:hypothetical protein
MKIKFVAEGDRLGVLKDENRKTVVKTIKKNVFATVSFAEIQKKEKTMGATEDDNGER